MKTKLLTILLLILFFGIFKTDLAKAQTSCPTPPTNTGTVTLSTTTTAGTYRVWSRMKSADSVNNSFYMRIDSNCAVLVGDSSQISTSTWTWVDYQNGTTTNKINVNLTAGNHTITLIGNEPGVSVDKILLTQDLSCVPIGNGDNCPAVTPTPTTNTPTPTTVPSCNVTPPTNTGTVTLSTTTTAGTYRVWTRMKAADATNNSVYLRIDSNCAVLVGDSSQISSTAWTWVDYQNGNTSSKINATLTSGNHTVTLIGNEPGVSVDKILLTQDLSCTPVNTGDNCPANSPTPTPSQTPQTTLGPRTTPPAPSGITVPSTIDKTGTTDVTSALQNWINSQPNGTAANPTVLIFPSGATYRMNTGLRVDNKSYITFWGYGATLRPMGNGSTTGNSGFRLQNSNFIKILGFRIKGANTDAGTANAYHSGGFEFSMGIALMNNSDDIEIADNWISHVFGDGIYISYDPTGFPDRVNMHHNLLELTGRQGIVPDSGADSRIEWNIIRDIAMSAIDAEDARGASVSLGPLYIRNNLIDRWTWSGDYTCHALPMDYAAGTLSSMHDIYIENNTFQGGCMAPSGTSGYPNTQDADISMWGTMAKSNIFIRNNTFNLPTNQRSGWAIRLNSVTNGEVSGNTIPGQTVQCTSCTNVVISQSNISSTPTPTPIVIIDNCPPFCPPTPTPAPTDITPPVISAISAINITQTSTNITWTLDEPATGQVEYGTTTAYGNLTKPELTFNYTTHIQALSGLSPNTIYHYRVKSSDQAGNQVVSGDNTFTTVAPTPIPCTFTGATWQARSNPTDEGTAVTLRVTGSANCVGAQVNFQVRENDSILEGGLDEDAKGKPANATFDVNNIATTTWTAEWQNDCSGLCNPPEYFFNASLASNPGTSRRSDDPLLEVNQIGGGETSPIPTILPTDTPTPLPACTVKSAAWSLDSKDEGQYIELNVSAQGNCGKHKVKFRVLEDDGLDGLLGDALSDSVKDNPPETTLVYDLLSNSYIATSSWFAEWQDDCNGLCNPPEYYFEAQVKDDKDSDVGSAVQSTSPLLSVNKLQQRQLAINPSITAASTNSSAAINWITNVSSSSQVEYGFIDQFIGSSSVLNVQNKITNHSVVISNLKECTTYKYRVKSSDSSSTAVGPGLSFTTKGCTGDATILSETTKYIDYVAGGYVDLLDNATEGLIIDIPASYSNSSAFFHIQKLEKNSVISKRPVPQNKQVIGNYLYSMHALTDLITDISIFSATISVMVNYTDADIAGINPATLKIYRFNIATNAWEGLQNCAIDTQEKTVTCETTKFSEFALFGETSVTPTQTPSSGGSSGGGGSSSGGGGGGSSGGGSSGGGTSTSADLNGDGKVNIFDLSILLRNWNKGGQGDLNKDGKVNIFDLSILVRAWR